MGFFTGFAPTSKAPILFRQYPPSPTSQQAHQLSSNTSISPTPQSPRPVPIPVPVPSTSKEADGAKLITKMEKGDEEEMSPRALIIIVTTIISKNSPGYEGVFLRRLSNTLRLVDPPLLWMIVEGQSDSNQVSDIVSKTGIMYRYLVCKQNFSNPETELTHHRNLALSHIEHHRLSGIVHFASLSNTYDLHFFHHLRDIEVFGTWAMALVSAKKQKVKIEGPVCESSQVIGWHLNNKTGPDNYNIHISTFAFNSSILWDPERWGRPSSAQRTNQNSIKYVKEIIVEDEGKLKGIPPSDCSKIMLWHFPFS